MTDKQVRELAKKIVDRLFTNGYGEKAQRIVLELPGKKDGGGIGYHVAIDLIIDELRKSGAVR